jgi:flagellar export protein FliJ
VKRFVFTLQRVLDARLRVEQAARRSLAQVMQHRVRLEARLAQAEQTRLQALHELRDGLVGRILLDDLRLQANCTLQQARQSRQWMLEFAALKPQVDQAQTTFATAVAARRGLELLRERAHHRWIQAARRAQRRDEMELTARSEP